MLWYNETNPQHTLPLLSHLLGVSLAASFSKSTETQIKMELVGKLYIFIEVKVYAAFLYLATKQM